MENKIKIKYESYRGEIVQPFTVGEYVEALSRKTDASGAVEAVQEEVQNVAQNLAKLIDLLIEKNVLSVQDFKPWIEDTLRYNEELVD